MEHRQVASRFRARRIAGRQQGRVVELATGDELAEADAHGQVRRAAQVALPIHQPDQRLKQDDQLHGWLQHRLLQALHQSAPDHRLQRVGEGGVEEHDAGDAAVDHRVLQQQGLDGHAADAVADQDRPLAAAGLDDPFQLLCEGFQVDGSAVGRTRLAQSRQVPEHEAEPIAEVALGLVPEGAVHAPAVGEDDRRAAGRTVRLDVDGRSRPARNHLPLAVPGARRPAAGSRQQERQDAAAQEGPGREADPGPQPPGFPLEVEHAGGVAEPIALMPAPEQVGRRREDRERQKRREEANN